MKVILASEVKLIVFVLLKRCLTIYLKECEFKFNQRGKDMYKVLLKIFRDKSLKLS